MSASDLLFAVDTYNHGLLIKMLLINKGIIYNSEEYKKELKKGKQISINMILKLSIIANILKNKELTKLFHEICHNKNLGPTQWETIYYMLKYPTSDSETYLLELRKYVDNIDREQSELYAEFVSSADFTFRTNSDYWLNYHNK